MWITNLHISKIGFLATLHGVEDADNIQVIYE